MSEQYKYLALGDSYTIGEQVLGTENFPNQTVQLLRKNLNLNIADPEIIATTGWTTDELEKAIDQAEPKTDYDLVSLLIGVNNQYRKLDMEVYKKEFAHLLSRAILFAGGRAHRVFVLSIPDWGVTPFAADKQPESIAQEIRAYNALNRAISLAYKCHYIDITPESRILGKNPENLSPDLLHYAASVYQSWAEQLAPMMGASLQSGH